MQAIGVRRLDLMLVARIEQFGLVGDSHALALQDWMGSAGFDRDEDLWPRRWAEAYVDFAAGSPVKSDIVSTNPPSPTDRRVSRT